MLSVYLAAHTKIPFSGGFPTVANLPPAVNLGFLLAHVSWGRVSVGGEWGEDKRKRGDPEFLTGTPFPEPAASLSCSLTSLHCLNPPHL